MSMANTYAKIEAALEEGERGAMAGKAVREAFEFPNEQRAYQEGYRKGRKAIARGITAPE